MGDTDRFLPRHLISELKKAVASARVVNLAGPRQVGKTTLVRHLFGHGHFITLDDSAVLAAIEVVPGGQLASLMQYRGEGPLIIDKAQRSKKLAPGVRRIVDADQRKGQFVLTGSSNVFTIAQVADSLAGRMRILKLWSLSAAEINSAPVNRFMDWACRRTQSSFLWRQELCVAIQCALERFRLMKKIRNSLPRQVQTDIWAYAFS